MKILRFPLGQLEANCYFLIKEDQCLIIDPADEASFILEELQRRDLKLVEMLATHGHFDHVMAAGEIQSSLKVTLYISKKDFFLINRLIDTSEHFLGYKPVIVPPKDIGFFDKEMFHVSPFMFHMLNTPGHTPGSCCFYFPEEKVIFTGDTLFKDGVGRWDFSYSNKKDLDNSLRKIFKLPEEITVYPGHGEKTILRREKYFLKFSF